MMPECASGAFLTDALCLCPYLLARVLAGLHLSSNVMSGDLAYLGTSQIPVRGFPAQAVPHDCLDPFQLFRRAILFIKVRLIDPVQRMLSQIEIICCSQGHLTVSSHFREVKLKSSTDNVTVAVQPGT